VSDVSDDGHLRNVCFSQVENLLVSLHHVNRRSDAFRLWDVDAGGMASTVQVRLDDEGNGCAFSRDGRQLVFICEVRSLWIHSVSDAQLIKVIHLVVDRPERSRFVGITTNGRQVVCVEMSQKRHRVCLWDIHGDGSPVEDVCVCQEGELASKIVISPLDDSIAIVTRPGVVKLAHRRARDMAWTIEVLNDGKCFDMTGKVSFSASGPIARNGVCGRRD
jgi:hypothetical protein